MSENESNQNPTKASSRNTRAKYVLPGDSLGAEEEFEAGPGSASTNGVIVASLVGEVSPDMANRVMRVIPAKQNIAKLPETGDFIIGSVQSASSSIAQVTIESVNEELSTKELSGMLSLRDQDRRRRNSTPVRPGDIIRAGVSSTVNSIIHLSLDCTNCGVLYTVCSFCGGRVIALGRGAVKCTECNSVDDRLLSQDFVTYSRSQH